MFAVHPAFLWDHAHRHFSTPLDCGWPVCVQQLCGLCNLANFQAKLHAMQPQPAEWVQGFFGVFPFNYEPLNASQVWLLPLFLLWLQHFSSCRRPWVQMCESFSCVVSLFFPPLQRALPSVLVSFRLRDRGIAVGFTDCAGWVELRAGKSMLDRPHYAANGLAQTFTGNYRHFAGHLLLDRCSCSCCHWGFHLALQLKS